MRHGATQCRTGSGAIGIRPREYRQAAARAVSLRIDPSESVRGKLMASTFSWLDHSERERRQVLDAIDRFKETFTRDELGLAAIRDGFSDLFFPGTSVLMTRARYFLFVPWIYLDIERRGRTDDVATKARRAEIQLVETLGDEWGAIGRLAKATLKRLPSSIYWLGLHRWGIRTFDGAQTDYHHFLEEGGGRGRDERDDDGEPIDGSTRRNWHAAIPSPADGFPKTASLALTSAEAEYLRERIRLSTPSSFLALLLKPGYLPDVEYPWLHPRLADFSPELREQLHHAQCFAEAMHGAALLYNLMLAEMGKRDTVETELHQRLDDFVRRGARTISNGSWRASVTRCSGDVELYAISLQLRDDGVALPDGCAVRLDARSACVGARTRTSRTGAHRRSRLSTNRGEVSSLRNQTARLQQRVRGIQ